MFSLGYLISGIIIGFSIAAPVGPIGLLCIQRTVMNGMRSGLSSGLGAASADAIYGAIAGIGIGIISTFLITESAWIQLTGGIALFAIGIRIYFKETSREKKEPGASRNRELKNYFSTFVLTLANPITILSFMAIFTSLGIAGSEDKVVSAGFLIVGVFTGSSLWWLFLTAAVAKVSRNPGTTLLDFVGRVSGLIIIGFGLFGIVRSGILF